MARHYRRRYRKPHGSYVWQPVAFNKQIQVPGGTIGTELNGLLFHTVPGVGNNADFKGFSNDHTLEKIIGSMAHNGEGITGGNKPSWFPFTLAAAKVPQGMFPPETGIDLFDSTELDDCAFRMDSVCNNASNTDAIPNWHAVNAKSRRKFNVGDKLSWLFSLVRNTATAFSVELALNVRILWKLKI